MVRLDDKVCLNASSGTSHLAIRGVYLMCDGISHSLPFAVLRD